MGFVLEDEHTEEDTEQANAEVAPLIFFREQPLPLFECAGITHSERLALNEAFKKKFGAADR